MASVNDGLRSSVGKARSATLGKGVHFDFVTGSGGAAALLIGEGSSAVAAAKKETKGSTVISGVCYAHEGALVFETKGNPPGSLAAQIQKCLKEHAGVTGKVEARYEGELEEKEHESEENAGGNQVDAGKAAKIAAHVKALTAKLGGAVASSNAGKAVKTKLAEANAAYKKGDMDAAEKLLTEGDVLLKGAEEQESEEEENQEKGDAKKRADRVAKITAHVKTITTKVSAAPASSDAGKRAKEKLAQASAAYKKGDLDEAESLLDESEELLK